MNTRGLVRCLLLGAIVLGMGACAPSAPEEPEAVETEAVETEAVEAETPETEGEETERVLRIGLASFQNETVHQLVYSTAVDFYTIGLVHDALIVADENGQPAPGVAESWEVSEDGRTWTFHIRQGLVFQNGDPLTAHDVEFTLDHHVTEPMVVRADDFAEAVGNDPNNVTAVDDYTVEIFTPEANVYLAEWLFDAREGMGIVWPQNYIETNGFDYYMEHPIGSGPWRFVSHEPGYSFVFERVDDPAFYEHHFREMPAFDRVEYYLVPEESTRIAMLEAGELDIVDIGLPSVPAVEAAGLSIVMQEPNVSFYVGLVNIDPIIVTDEMEPGHAMEPEYQERVAEVAALPTADVRVRQALNLAIDRQAIWDEMFYGYAEMPEALIRISHSCPEVDAERWDAWAEENYVYDPERARELLAEAGYPDGFDIHFHIFNMGGSPWMIDVALAVTGYWADIGVRSQVHMWEWGGFSDWRAGYPEELWGNAMIMRHTVGGPPAIQATSQWTWSGWGSGTYPLYYRPESAHLFESSANELDPAVRFELVNQFIETVAPQFPAVMLGATGRLFGVGDNVIWENARPNVADPVAFGVEDARPAQ